MSPVERNHFTHPNHPLVFHSDDDKDFICDGCKTYGTASRFSCRPCQFDLHEFCAECPEKLTSFAHHHNLTLVGADLNKRFCDVCCDPVEGLFYRCKDCDFDAHPICTQLPQELRHAADNTHPLKLHNTAFGSCAVCKKYCSSLWVYGCEICGLNIHVHCMCEPYVSPSPPVLDIVPANLNYGDGDHGWRQSEDENTGSPPSSPCTLGKAMFNLVGKLTVNAVSTAIFGFPIDF